MTGVLHSTMGTITYISTLYDCKAFKRNFVICQKATLLMINGICLTCNYLETQFGNYVTYATIGNHFLKLWVTQFSECKYKFANHNRLNPSR